MHQALSGHTPPVALLVQHWKPHAAGLPPHLSMAVDTHAFGAPSLQLPWPPCCRCTVQQVRTVKGTAPHGRGYHEAVVHRNSVYLLSGRDNSEHGDLYVQVMRRLSETPPFRQLAAGGCRLCLCRSCSRLMCRAYISACCACFAVCNPAGLSRQHVPAFRHISSSSESACPGLQDGLWQFDCVLNKWLKPSVAAGEPLQRSSHRSVVWGDQVLTCHCCMARYVEHSLQPPHSADHRLEFAACPQHLS